MNHFIAGILKIALLEASIALLLIDLAAGERFKSLREKAHTVVTGLMVLAFCNYGALHPSNDPAVVLTAVPLLLLAARAVSFGFDPNRAERWAAAIARAKANPKRTGRWGSVYAAIALVILFTWLNDVPGGAWGVFGGILAAVFTGQAVERVASGERKLPGGLSDAVAKHGRALAVAVVILTSGGWVAAGVGTGRSLLIHQWEQFHFYLGAKYQAEVGWFNLYKAVIIADRESAHALDALQTTRDLATFETISVADALQDADAVKARFSPEQWANFKADWVQMTQLWHIDWSRIINDHGNSNSPAWSIIATPLVKLTPLTMRGQAFLGWIDILLMVGMWLFLWQVFGHRAATTGLLMWAGLPIIFEYSTGSILRWDWLFALGLAAGCLKQKRYGWAGALFGFAVATKLFPLFFGIAMGLRAAMEWRRTRKLKPEHVRFAVSSAVSGVVVVAVAAVLFGASAWKEYYGRIQIAQLEKFYGIQYSFKSVYLQHAAGTPREWTQAIFPAALKQTSDKVETCKGSSSSNTGATCSTELTQCGDARSFALSCQGDECVCRGRGKEERFTEANACSRVAELFVSRCQFPEDYSTGLFLAQVLFTLLVMVLLRRADDVEAFLLGPLLVFCWLTVNMYYWNMLGLMVLGLVMRSERPQQKPALGLTLGLHLVFMVFYLYQHLNRQSTEGYAVAWMFTVLTLITAAWEFFLPTDAPSTEAA